MIFLFRDCELDTDAYELRRHGRPCPVEPQVFDLLLHLVRHRGRVVTREEIFETIWKGRVVSESALSSRINAVRRAIGDRGSETRHVRTVFRRGFRFVGDVQIRESAREASGPLGERSGTTGESLGSPHAATDRAGAGRTYLCGRFACYSHAWSPAFQGRLVRGALAIEHPAPSSRTLSAMYSESLPHGALRHRGPVTFSDQTLYLDLLDARTDSRAFVNLLCPGPPASALLGVMSGKVFHDPSSEIAVTRIVAVRVPVQSITALEKSNRYLDRAAESCLGDLRALGLAVRSPSQLKALFEDFLEGGPASGHFRVTAAENATINVEIDRALTGTAVRSAPHRARHSTTRL